MDRFDPYWKELENIDKGKWLSVGWDRRGQNTGYNNTRLIVDAT